MFVKYLLLASTLLCGVNALFGSMKNITVVGRIFCGRVAAGGVTVELWEDDTVFGINRDDKLNVTKTDYNGRFKVYGQKKEIFNIEPYILIKHTCLRNDEPFCDVTDRRDISKRYLGGTYEFDVLELGEQHKGRKKSCK